MSEAREPEPDRSVGHARINHDFTFEDLHYDKPENYMCTSSLHHSCHLTPWTKLTTKLTQLSACIKVCSFFRKRPDVSHEHFHKHYAHVHADIVTAAKAFGALKVLRYSQFHQFPRDKERLRGLGRTVLDYDGCSTTWFRDWDDAEAFWQSKELKDMFQDCANFMDVSEGGGPAAMAG